MKRALPTLIGLVVLVAIGFGASRLLTPSGGQEEAPHAPRPLPVTTATMALESSVAMERRFTGAITARRTSDLSFEGSGRVIEILVDDGDAVATGDVLARLDTAVLAAQRAEIASKKARLGAQLAELVAGPREETITAARADIQALEGQLALGILLRDRREPLVAKGTISSEQLDTARTEVSTVTAQINAARARLAELENGTRAEVLAAQRGAVGEVDAALAAIDVSIDKATLKAPYAGRIAARMVDEGAIVSQTFPSTAFTIVESDALEARVGVPPDLAAAIATGATEAILEVRGRAVAALSRVVLPTVDAGTRTVTVVFAIDPGPADGLGLRPGDIATLSITVTRPETGAWVPLSALAESTRGLWSLYRTVQGEGGQRIAERVEVEVLHVKDGLAFVRGTLIADSEIIVSGAHRLVPGQSVEAVGPNVD